MANVLGTLFQNIADAIRSKTGGTDTMKPADFPEHIRNIASSTGGEEMAMELIWTNPATSSDFAAQTLTFEKNYKYFLLEYFNKAGDTLVNVETLPITSKNITLQAFGKIIEVFDPATTTLEAYLREVTVSENSIKFTSGQLFSFGNTQDVKLTGYNGGCVPYRIWGFS